MFARNVSVRLKPNVIDEFSRKIEKEIIPLLRKQKGFQDEISLVNPDGTQAVGISLWDTEESAKAYARGAFPEVLRAMSELVEGTPDVHTYEVANSTLHKIAAPPATV